MSALTLTLKYQPSQRVDMSPLVCQQLKNLTLNEIGELTLQNAKAKVRVDELFTLSGDDTQNIVIKNSFEKLDFIGKDLIGGTISVEGNVGAYCGMGMKSGQINIQGNVGIFAACEMKQGLLTIHGDVGDFLGGALVGNKIGMKGGVVLVRGNVGERAGDHLRRGLILIEGNAGDYCGSRMTAGTIAVMGKVGQNIGYAMRRGTLLLWQKPAQIPATFNDCGTHTLAFLPLLLASFKAFNSTFAKADLSFNRVQRYGGDLANMGRGELLIKV
jgi:formylmethanofuran dehydrogenase subunit C